MLRIARMRVLVRLTLAACVGAAMASAEEAKSPFRGEMRRAVDEDGRISITVPKRWTDKELAEGQVLRVYALGSGGHDIKIERRQGEGDVSRMRDEFLKHDSAALPGSTVKKYASPFFGYRVDAPGQQRVVLRAFAPDGNDGLVLTITSRFAHYEKLYWKYLSWVAGSLTVEGRPTGNTDGGGDAATGARRIHDKDGKFSVLAPAGWKPTEAKEYELLSLSPGGRARGTRILVDDLGDSTTDSLVLTKIATEWKRNYPGAVMKRLPGDPPRLLVKGRQGDSVDYFIGLANGDHGYSMRLIVREESYERTRSIADEMARSLVFTESSWQEPQSPEKDLDRLHRKSIRLHGAAEFAGHLDELAAEFDRFMGQWKRLGFPVDRKAPPLHALVCPEGEFAATANLFGEPPAAYDRLTRIVVVVPPPSEDAPRAAWRGAVDAAFTEAILHRDLNVPAPAWFRRGLAHCMRSSGLQNGKPDGAVPALVGVLAERAGDKPPEPLATVLAWTEGDFLRDDSSEKAAHAWGYTHLMLYGRGGLPNAYKKWRKSLLKANRKTPAFKVGKYEKDAADLQAYIQKHWVSEDK